MALWSRHKAKCRPIGNIVADARSGNLPGVAEIESGHGYRVTNEAAALAAMRKGSRNMASASPGYSNGIFSAPALQPAGGAPQQSRGLLGLLQQLLGQDSPYPDTRPEKAQMPQPALTPPPVEIAPQPAEKPSFFETLLSPVVATMQGTGETVH